MHASPRFLAVLTCLALFTTTVTAQIISGHLQTSAGANLSGVTVEVDGGAFTATTNVLGNFSVTVGAGIHDVTFAPAFAQSTTLAPAQRAGVVVAATGTVNLGNIVLLPAITITGTVLLAGGTPANSADVDIVNAATGEKLFTPQDNTTATGTFSVTAPAGTYYVEADAPTGLLYVSQRAGPFTVTAPGPFASGTITLQPGVALSGTVRNATTLAVLANVDIDVDIVMTNERVPTPDDKTSALGVFNVVVPPNTLYRLSFDPPVGMLVAGRRIEEFFVGATATSTGNVDLTPGVLVTGTVVGPGNVPLQGADIDMDFFLGGNRAYISNDKSFSNGTFQIVLAAGSYLVTAAPPAGQVLVAQRLPSTLIVGTTTQSLGTITLPAGVVLSGTVTASFSGLPEFDANVDVFNSTTGALVATPSDRTNAAGFYSVIVPNNATYNVLCRTRKGSLARDLTQQNVVVAGATTENFTLSMVPMFLYMLSAITTNPIVIPNGSPIVVHAAIFNPTGVTTVAMVRAELVEPSGNVVTIVPPFQLTMFPGDNLIALFVPIPLGPLAPGAAGFQHEFRIVSADPATGEEYDRDGVVFLRQ